MKTFPMLVAVVLAGGLLAACGEPDQTMQPNARKNAGKVWQGYAAPAAFIAPGWKIDNQESWQQQIQDRTQYGQNEYNRTSAPR